jgi:hypothetical protein
MTEFRENIGRKRRATDLLNDDEDAKKLQNNSTENYLASEEEIKKRRIVRVIRNSDSNPDNTKKGKFNIIGGGLLLAAESNLKENQLINEKGKQVNTENKAEQNIKVENVISLKSSVTSDDNKKIENSHNQAVINKEEKRDTLKIENNSMTNSNINVNVNLETKKIKFGNEISTTPNVACPLNITFNNSSNFNPTNFTNPFIKSNTPPNYQLTLQNTELNTKINKNPFGTVGTNPFTNSINQNPLGTVGTNAYTNSINQNPFIKTSNTSSLDPSAKPKFNFNLNTVQDNPNWDSDDDQEEGGAENNPEEEIKIENKISLRPEITVPKSNSRKAIKMNIEDLSVYSYEDKKYFSKGKGEISLELTKSDKENVLALCIFRNSSFMSLFCSNILKGVTICESVTKKFKYFALIQKMVNRDESTGKNIVKSVKLAFFNEKDSILFKEKFKVLLEVLEKNDLSLLREESTEK